MRRGYTPSDSVDVERLFKEVADRNYHEVVFIGDQYSQDVLGNLRSSFEHYVHDELQSRRKIISATRFENNKSILALQEKMEATTTLSDDLRKFASTIGQGERRWFTWHDRAPVWAASGVAALLAFLRLYGIVAPAHWLGAGILG